jgi:hypothetical protein
MTTNTKRMTRTEWRKQVIDAWYNADLNTFKQLHQAYQNYNVADWYLSMFINSCKNGNLEMAQFMYGNNKYNWKRHNGCFYGFKYAFVGRRTEVVSWLETLPEFNTKIQDRRTLYDPVKEELARDAFSKNNILTYYFEYIKDSYFLNLCGGRRILEQHNEEKNNNVDDPDYEDYKNYNPLNTEYYTESEFASEALNACDEGNLYKLKYVHERCPYLHIINSSNNLFSKACSDNYLDIANWLYLHYEGEIPNSEFYDAFRNAIIKDHKDVLEWLENLSEIKNKFRIDGQTPVLDELEDIYEDAKRKVKKQTLDENPVGPDPLSSEFSQHNSVPKSDHTVTDKPKESNTEEIERVLTPEERETIRQCITSEVVAKTMLDEYGKARLEKDGCSLM